MFRLKRKISLQTCGILLVLFPMLAASGGSLAALYNGRGLGRRIDELQREVLIFEKLLVGLNELQSSARGYALTDDRESLSRYLTARSSFQLQFREVRNNANATTSSHVWGQAPYEQILTLGGQILDNASALVQERDKFGRVRPEKIANGNLVGTEFGRLLAGWIDRDEATIGYLASKTQTVDAEAQSTLIGAILVAIISVTLVLRRMSRERQWPATVHEPSDQDTSKTGPPTKTNDKAERVEPTLRGHSADTPKEAIEETSLGIVEFDAALVVTHWNGAATKAFGISATAAVGRSFSDVFKEKAAFFGDVLEHCRSGDRVRGMPVHFQTPSGEMRDILLSGVAWRHLDGELLGYAFLLDDLTERYAIERTSRSTERLQSLGQLTGGIVHDFNNLLNTIVMNMDLALEAADDRGKAVGFVKDALRSALRGTTLTKRLLDFACDRSPETASVNPNEVLRDFASFMRRTLGETIEIRVVVEPDVWPVEVNASELEDAMTNLAMNARDLDAMRRNAIHPSYEHLARRQALSQSAGSWAGVCRIVLFGFRRGNEAGSPDAGLRTVLHDKGRWDRARPKYGLPLCQKCWRVRRYYQPIRRRRRGRGHYRTPMATTSVGVIE